MKFKLSSSGAFYRPEEAKELESLGFTFKTTKEIYGTFRHAEFYKDGESEVEINTLEELLQFIKRVGRVVIDENEIEIYDDYRE